MKYWIRLEKEKEKEREVGELGIQVKTPLAAWLVRAVWGSHADRLMGCQEGKFGVIVCKSNIFMDPTSI